MIESRFLPQANYQPPAPSLHDPWPKRQIYLHHTAGASADSTVEWFARPYNGCVAAGFVVARSGRIIQLIPDDGSWAWHLGLKLQDLQTVPRARSNVELNAASIAIELASRGPVTPDLAMPPEDVVHHRPAWRGHVAYERYRYAQIESLRYLLLLLCLRHRIPPIYRPEMWDMSAAAMKGEPGIWTHASVRRDKSDCHPQSELRTMLQELSSAVDDPTRATPE